MSVRLKVCVLTSVHPPLDVRIFHREAVSLARNGYEVTVIAPSAAILSALEGVRLLAIPAAASRLGRLWNIRHLVHLALREDADVYHFHDPELLPCGLFLRVVTGKPVIYDVHEDYADTIIDRQWIPAWARKPAAWLVDHLEKLLGSRMSAIVAATDPIADRFAKSGRAVITVQNFPSAERYAHVIQTRNRSGPRGRLVYVGAISGVRGLWIMLDTVRLLVEEHVLDVELVLAGGFSYPAEQEQFATVLAEDAILRERVTWLGIVDQKSLPDLLSSADVGLVPLQPVKAYLKGIPTKQFEYMACALPIVGSDLPPIRFYLEASGAGRVAVAQDPHSHAAEIAFLLRQPEVARSLGRNGRVAFRERYNWSSEERKLLGLYSRLLPLGNTEGLRSTAGGAS